jgi:xylulose-5-phosphate/fructose-6-phosphate phosphoketolase
MPATLSPDLLEKMDAYWRAANYLTVGQIYLKDNPLLETPLKIEMGLTRLDVFEEAQKPFWQD